MQMMQLMLGGHDPPPSEQFVDLVCSCLGDSYQVERGTAAPVLRLLIPPREARGAAPAVDGCTYTRVCLRSWCDCYCG